MPLSVGLNTVVSTPLSVYQLRHHFSYKNPLLPLLDSLYSDLSLVQNRLTNFQVLSNSKVYRMTRTFPYDTLGNNKSFPFAVFRASSSFLSIASGQLGCNFGIDFHLWVNTRVVHHEVIHAFLQENADFEQQIQRDTDFPVFDVANMCGCAVTKACQFLLGKLLLFPCDFHTLSKQDVI